MHAGFTDPDLEAISHRAHRECYLWLCGSLATTPANEDRTEAAAGLYSGALAAVVQFAFEEFAGQGDAQSFGDALMIGVRSYVEQLANRAPVQ